MKTEEVIVDSDVELASIFHHFLKHRSKLDEVDTSKVDFST